MIKMVTNVLHSFLLLLMVSPPPKEAVVQDAITWSRMYASTMVNLTSNQFIAQSTKLKKMLCGTACMGLEDCFGYEYTEMDGRSLVRTPGNCMLIRGNGAANFTVSQLTASVGTDVFWLKGIKTRSSLYS